MNNQTVKYLKSFFESELAKDVSFLKVGTESEAMSLPQIALLIWITSKEVVCKIGGPDARSDIQSLFGIGIQRFVAPMIESPFGVIKFIEAISKTIGIEAVDELAINVESICAMKQIEEILEISKENINRVNVGFSDLAASLGTDVMDPDVMKMAKNLRNRCKILGKEFSFGGTVTPENIEARLAYLEADSFETRIFGFDATIGDPAKKVKKALEFEAEFEQHVADSNQQIVNQSINRSNAIMKRLAIDINLAA